MARQRTLTDEQVREIRAWKPQRCVCCNAVTDSENAMAKRYKQWSGSIRAVRLGHTYKDVK